MKTKFILLTAFIFILTAFANAQSSLVGEWEIISITDAKVGNVDLDAGQNMVTFEKKDFTEASATILAETIRLPKIS